MVNENVQWALEWLVVRKDQGRTVPLAGKGLEHCDLGAVEV